MKRSKMVSNLEELLQKIPVSDNGSYYQDADIILTFIEDMGMQPPKYFDIEYYDEPECDGYISEWEKE